MKELFNSPTKDGWRIVVDEDDNSKPIVSPTSSLGNGFEPRSLFQTGEGVLNFFRPSAEGDAAILAANPSIVVISGFFDEEDQERIINTNEPMDMKFLMEWGGQGEMTILSFIDEEQRNLFVAKALAEWPDQITYVTQSGYSFTGNQLMTKLKTFLTNLGTGLRKFLK